ncbi:MAG: Uma2 family endonuclease [Scytonematopsis contorta HA4267-MV1]|jgi:Uma2 family endonuclease|nr:Uma2 family endonuclease [Scytonematopsis contorta HA4267-MV1]
MTAIISVGQKLEPFYPSADGEPVAETFDHLYAIITVLEVLRQYLAGQQATVLANQFLYYAQERPKLRVASDVMVIFDVAPGGRDSYTIWKEGQVPAVIFEMTSPGTKNQDIEIKKGLYQQLGVKEYWLFDPKDEYLEKQLTGYHLVGVKYEEILDYRSEVLQLRLQIEGKIIAFYREDTGEKLLISDELAQALQRETLERRQAQEQAEQERQRAEQERQRAEQALSEVEQLKQRLRSLGIDPDTM